MLKEEMVSAFSMSFVSSCLASLEKSSLCTSLVSFEMFNTTCKLSHLSSLVVKRTPISWSSCRTGSSEVMFFGNNMPVISMWSSIV